MSDAAIYRFLDQIEAASRFVEVQRPAHSEDVWSEQTPVIRIPHTLLRSLDGRNPEFEWHVVIPAVGLPGAISMHDGGYGEYGDGGSPQ